MNGTNFDENERGLLPLHGAILSLSGSMISISFFSDAPFINALIAVSVFPFLGFISITC